MRTLIRSAIVVDGSGADRYPADVLVEGGLIVGIGTVAADDAGLVDRVIDAAGRVLCPGFVDMHAHSDLQILTRPDHYAKISQGVTTELLGQDGLSYAPVDDDTLAGVRRQIAGWNADPADFDFSWRTVGAYLDRLDGGIAVNAAYLIPQGTVRALVMGFGEGAASPAQLTQMCGVVADGMREGAVGLSSGLTYTPGMYADDAELTALCRVVAGFGGFYAPHHRSYGKGALDAYAEMIGVARDSGCALHLSHATMNFAPNRGRAGELLALLDAALADGVDISLDTYPYLPGATTLSAILPSWSSAGGAEATLTPALRPGCTGPHPRGRGGQRLRRLPRGGGRMGHDRDQRHPASGTRRATSAGPSRRSRPTRRVPRSRSSWTSCAETGWAPASCSTSGTRLTCAPSWATARTPAAATGSWSVPSRTRAPGAPSRAIWGTTAAISACSPWKRRCTT